MDIPMGIKEDIMVVPFQTGQDEDKFIWGGGTSMVFSKLRVPIKLLCQKIL